MKPGKLAAAGMAVIAPERKPPFRPEKTAEQRRIAELEHQLAVAVFCIEIALDELAFERFPTARLAARQIQIHCAAAKIGIGSAARAIP